MKKIKVDVKEGVYLHDSGNYFTVEFGEVSNEEGTFPAVKTHGCNEAGEEVCRIFTMEDEYAVVLFVRVIHSSEYLGEL